jgi:hypothetical protein
MPGIWKEKFSAALAHKRTRKARDEFDEIGLPFNTGFLEQSAEVGLDRAIRNPKRLGDLGTATNLDQSEQNAQFGRGQLVSLGDGFRS